MLLYICCITVYVRAKYYRTRGEFSFEDSTGFFTADVQLSQCGRIKSTETKRKPWKISNRIFVYTQKKKKTKNIALHIFFR